MRQKYEVNIRWEKGHRYYEAQVMEDLYGWVFVRTWGKKDTRLGRSIRVRVDSCEEGLKAMKQVKKRREYRGYELEEDSVAELKLELARSHERTRVLEEQLRVKRKKKLVG